MSIANLFKQTKRGLQGSAPLQKAKQERGYISTR